MRVIADPRAPGPIVTGFGPGGFRISEGYHRAVLLAVDALREWSPPALEALTAIDLAWLLELRPEFVLLGTGPTLRRPPPALIRGLDVKGVGVETMDSRAAARLWGVLRGEGRQIAAALYPLD